VQNCEGTKERWTLTRLFKVAGVGMECTECADPLIASHWRYQRQYVDKVIETVNGRPQMVYLSKNQGDTYDAPYTFDESAGDAIPVYIVDTGAQLDHTVRICQIIP
jgi:hypothetical protein